MKKLTLAMLAVTLMVANAVFAYYTPYGTNSDNSKAAKYYRGEISADEYVDSLGVPRTSSQNHGTVHGELRKNDIGNGYTYKDTTGRHMEFHERPFGLSGYDVYSNE